MKLLAGRLYKIQFIFSGGSEKKGFLARKWAFLANITPFFRVSKKIYYRVD